MENDKRTKSFVASQEKNPEAFTPDAEIANSWVFWFFSWYYHFAVFFNALAIRGVENFPPNEGCLLVGTHTTHNVDIFTSLVALQKSTGRVSRSLFHRVLMQCHPYLRNLGGVAGRREVAKHLIQSKHIVGVLPGGAEEAMRGHENAYNLNWESSTGRQRLGFAQVALSIGHPVKIIPVFIKNGEEMRFNPIFFLWNLLYLSKAFDVLMEFLRKHSAPIARAVFLVASLIWFTLSWLAIPIPVKVTIIVGEPIIVQPKDKPEDVADRVIAAMRGLITKHQPHGHSYLPGLRERFGKSEA